MTNIAFATPLPKQGSLIDVLKRVWPAKRTQRDQQPAKGQVANLSNHMLADIGLGPVQAQPTTQLWSGMIGPM